MDKRTRGRPAQNKEEIKTKLLKSATKVLLNAGFARFTIDAVAKSGRIAKKTIYGFVPNREALIGEIVASWTARFWQNDIVMGDNGEEPRVAGLEALLFKIFRTALAPEAIALFRMISSEADARERLAKVYDDNGIQRAILALSEALSEQTVCAEVELTAQAMLAWLIGEPLRKASLGLEMPYEFPDTEVRRRIAICLSLYSPLLTGTHQT